MVMKRNITGKNLRRTIKGSIGRYLAIVLIIALGSSIFVGLLSTKRDMVATGQKFTDQQNMFDLRLLCTYGWTDADVATVAQMAGVTGAEGHYSMDAVVYVGEEQEGMVYQIHSIPAQIDKVHLLGGRMPEKPNECLLDGFHVGDEVLGKQILIADENEELTKENLAYHSYTVVGYVSTPIYMDMSRGSTDLGSGNVTGYLYFQPEAFALDVYTEIAVTIEGDYKVYSDAFIQALEKMAEVMEPNVTVLAQNRFISIKNDAEAEYADGLKEYEDGMTAFHTSKETVLNDLADALQSLEDAQKRIDDGWMEVQNGYAMLEAGQAELDTQSDLLQASRKELLAAKLEAYQQMSNALQQLTDNKKQVTDALVQVEDGIAQIDTGILQIDAGMLAMEDGLQQIEDGLPKLELLINLKKSQVTILEITLKTAENALIPDQKLIDQLRAELESAQQELDAYLLQQSEAIAMQQELNAQLDALKSQREELLAQREELLQTQAQLEEALKQIQVGFAQLEESKLQAQLQFDSAEAQLDAAQLELNAAQAEIDAGRKELDAAAADLTKAQAELDEGRAAYLEGEAEALSQLAEAEAKLLDAADQLAEGRKAIDALKPAELFILDRNTNTGYIALDNNSDIVAGVSRVFPAFFLLIAALVCITTMTRMVEEERTQIGTMKALGYSNWRIISKYVYYAGSAAIVGCGLGTILGSYIFPTILWNAYKILFNILPNTVYVIDWPLCMMVVLAYTAVVLLVTWYCCRRSLKEAPAELIRPKAPSNGKKILLERLFFWERLSFLNKVMLRNVVRYRQRMLMMLIGVGGCTALLLTGFGLRDSLVNIVSDQFEEVTVYDLSVYFAEAQTQEQQESFLQTVEGQAEQAMFYYQTSVKLDYDNNVRELFMVVADQGVQDFVHFSDEETRLATPGLNEVLLSAGIAKNMGISVGDTVVLQDASMRTLQLRVSGIYDNMVSNYAFLTPQTYAAQTGAAPGYQMAFVNVAEYMDVHNAAALIGGLENVINVMICEDTAKQVTSMLDALDLLVLTIVICAGALAVIVLYNLTNINITERIREIATIKVLGFHNAESAMYVFKENLLLSGMGVLVGLLMGKYLLAFVISQIKVDIVFLQPQISVLSCVLAVVLTMLSAVIVDFLLYFKLGKINMAEALKSVE